MDRSRAGTYAHGCTKMNRTTHTLPRLSGILLATALLSACDTKFGGSPPAPPPAAASKSTTVPKTRKPKPENRPAVPESPAAADETAPTQPADTPPAPVAPPQPIAPVAPPRPLAGAGGTVKLIEAAPFFALPDAQRTPLIVGKTGWTAKVRAVEGAWYQVEFQDPQWGRRVGYVETRHTALTGGTLPVDPARAAAATVAQPGRNQPAGSNGMTGLPTYEGASVTGRRMAVTIIDRRINPGAYEYVVPGRWKSDATASAGCVGYSTMANCGGASRASGSATPPREVTYRVTGATFSVQLPDGRVAVVNCDSKYVGGIAAATQRDCRVPPGNQIEAEFKGSDATLFWPVNKGGNKLESETYRILGVLDRQ